MREVDGTLKERGNNYGSFEKNAMTSQMLKALVVPTSAVLTPGSNKPSEETYLVVSEALDNICQKLARIANGDFTYIDNWHDIQGYAKLVEDHLREINGS